MLEPGMQDHLSISSHGGGYVSVFQADLQALQRSLVGELISPAHPSYERARRVWNAPFLIGIEANWDDQPAGE